MLPNLVKSKEKTEQKCYPKRPFMPLKACNSAANTREPELTKWQWSSEYSTSEHQRKKERRQCIKKPTTANWYFHKKPHLCCKPKSSSP
jgi:hypothetical protein